MVKGSTPTHIFNIPFPITDPTAALLTYSQNDIIIVQKELSDMEITNAASTSRVTVSLTQEETFKFKKDVPVEIQMRIEMAGIVRASDIARIPVTKCLDKEVL